MDLCQVSRPGLEPCSSSQEGEWGHTHTSSCSEPSWQRFWCRLPVWDDLQSPRRSRIKLSSIAVTSSVHRKWSHSSAFSEQMYEEQQSHDVTSLHRRPKTKHTCTHTPTPTPRLIKLFQLFLKPKHQLSCEPWENTTFLAFSPAVAQETKRSDSELTSLLQHHEGCSSSSFVSASLCFWLCAMGFLFWCMCVIGVVKWIEKGAVG